MKFGRPSEREKLHGLSIAIPCLVADRAPIMNSWKPVLRGILRGFLDL